MERFVKVKGRWLDTLEEQKKGNYYMLQSDGNIYLLQDQGDDILVGKLEDQGNLLVKDDTVDFINNNPKKGYKSYLKYCESNNIQPVKKSQFKKLRIHL